MTSNTLRYSSSHILPVPKELAMFIHPTFSPTTLPSHSRWPSFCSDIPSSRTFTPVVFTLFGMLWSSISEWLSPVTQLKYSLFKTLPETELSKIVSSILGPFLGPLHCISFLIALTIFWSMFVTHLYTICLFPSFKCKPHENRDLVLISFFFVSLASIIPVIREVP